jgi:hypothetical protein
VTRLSLNVRLRSRKKRYREGKRGLGYGWNCYISAGGTITVATARYDFAASSVKKTKILQKWPW